MRILLISHEASRSGAPRVALLAAKALSQQGHQVELIVRSDGPMRAELAATVPTSLEHFSRLRRWLWRRPGLQGLAWWVDTLLALATIAHRRPDLVYVNSTAASIYLRPALFLRRLVLLHVHESGPLIATFLRRARFSTLLPGVTVVACAASVRRVLSELSGRPEGSIFLVPSVPDETQVRTLANQAPDRSYRPGEFVIGCCGSVEHRKGASLWVEVAHRVRAALPQRDIRFVWVGEVDHHVAGAVEAGVEFVGPSANPYAHMRQFDIATLPSRDDPFPLVVLESMAVGTPVVAFDVGSVALQVGEAGVVVEAGNVAAFADAIVTLILDDEERSRLGVVARARVDEHYSVHAFGARLVSVVGSVEQGMHSSRPARPC